LKLLLAKIFINSVVVLVAEVLVRKLIVRWLLPHRTRLWVCWMRLALLDYFKLLGLIWSLIACLQFLELVHLDSGLSVKFLDFTKREVQLLLFTDMSLLSRRNTTLIVLIFIFEEEFDLWSCYLLFERLWTRSIACGLAACMHLIERLHSLQ
jgi:hypothetical protein